MQRKNSEIANNGSMLMQAVQAYNNGYTEKPKSCNYQRKELPTHGQAHFGQKNINDQPFHQHQIPQQSFQYIRASSPAQNDSRRSFPTFIVKNSVNNMPHQGSFLGSKVLSPNGTNNFSQFPQGCSRNKTGLFQRNYPSQQTLQSPTLIRNANNGHLKQFFANNTMMTAPVTSLSPNRTRTSNNSQRTTNLNPNPSQFLSTQSQISSQPQSLSSSSNYGTAHNNGGQKNSSVYHSVIIQKNQSQNNFKSLLEDQKNLKSSVLFSKQIHNKTLIHQNPGLQKNYIVHQQRPSFKPKFKSGFGDMEQRFSTGSPSSPPPNMLFLNKGLEEKGNFSHKTDSDNAFYQFQMPTKQKKSDSTQGPSFLKKVSKEKNASKAHIQENIKTDKNDPALTSTAQDYFKKQARNISNRPRKESMPWKPSNLLLPQSNSKLKGNSVNAKTIKNSNSNTQLSIVQSPIKLHAQKTHNSNSATNLLSLQSPLKLDKMKNLVNKKNSNVNSRKLNEQSPEKIMRERRTLEETPRQTPRTSIEPKDIAWKRKPQLIFEMQKIVEGDQAEAEVKPIREISIDDFEIVEKIGKGTYGDVFLAQDRKTRFLCVIKALSKKKIKEMHLEQHVFRQIKIQSFLNHRHLTALFGVFDEKDKIYLILEFMPDGNMASNGKKKIKQNQTAYLMQQVCEGLLYMHREDIIHRDIKPENILMNNHYVKIADFGTSVFGNQMRRTVVGCLAYISPEQLTNTPYDDKIDAWSIGILAYQLLVGKPPFEDKIRNLTTRMYDGEPIENIKKRIEEKADFPELVFPSQLNLSEEAKDFIKKLLEADPFLRPDLRWALKHKFMQKGREYQTYLDSQL